MTVAKLAVPGVHIGFGHCTVRHQGSCSISVWGKFLPISGECVNLGNCHTGAFSQYDTDGHDVQVPTKGALAGEYATLVMNLTPPLSKANVGGTAGKLGN